mmetsp:Transcript_1094/g.2014  ORF Transcript_1094/g.2014 Transcript_1094/m.2014 type:complete len:117 (+) Transcript_1094:14-364(+)
MSQKNMKDPNNGQDYDFFGKEVEIGIDEAGRGPVLGPMVYGCAFWPYIDDEHSMKLKKEYGFQDSKKLNETQRDKIFKLIEKNRFKELGYFVTVLSAQELSTKMQADPDKGGSNLN